MKRHNQVCIDENGKMIWEYRVRVHGKEEMQKAIAFLEEKGFENVQKLTAENYKFPVLIVKYGCFFGTNTTCMACAATQGDKTISLKEFMERIGE